MKKKKSVFSHLLIPNTYYQSVINSTITPCGVCTYKCNELSKKTINDFPSCKIVVHLFIYYFFFFNELLIATTITSLFNCASH